MDPEQWVSNELHRGEHMNKLMAFFRDEQGLTMIEYAVAGGLITLGAVVAFTDLGTAVGTKITAVKNALN